MGEENLRDEESPLEPSKATQAAMQEPLVAFATVDELMTDLNSNDQVDRR